MAAPTQPPAGDDAEPARPGPVDLDGPAVLAPDPRESERRRAAMPEPGRDYPRTWTEFCELFPDDDACARYLERLSWPDGFVCPACGAVARKPWRGSRRRLVCPSCEHQTTVTAGTLFQGTRTPLSCWFAAAWLIATAEQGISARDLQRRLGLASYETAWTLLHRYRRAMVRSGRPRLSGVVEIGETWIGRRSLVALAVEDRGAEPGRVRMQRMGTSGAAGQAAFLAWAVEPGAVVRTAHAGLGGPRERGDQPPPDRPGPRTAGRPPLAFVELVARLLRSWLEGTHQGAASPAQLDWYLDEFTFRFNRRWATHRGLLFYRLVEEALVTPPLPYEAITVARPSPTGPRGLEPRG